MLDGIYATAEGLEAFTKRQEVIATNLANANTFGFKRNITDFERILEKIDGYEETESLRANIAIDFSKGNLEYTGNSLDIAIDGKGFFTIETEEGLRYTRSGQFQLSGGNEIITPSGDILLAAAGPIRIPRGSSRIEIDINGAVKADDRVVGNLLITNFEQPSLLIPKDKSLFEAPIAAIEDLDNTDFKIAQGYLERANVNVVMEMVTMIENMRNYEASANVMKNFSDTVQGLIRNLANV